jgi:uncharacterized membrane protein YtjA (UPF0391 family)
MNGVLLSVPGHEGPAVPPARCRTLIKERTMLHYAIVFLVIALIAAVLGFAGIAGAAAGIAKILFFVFLVLFVVSLIAGRRRPL